MHCLEQCVNRLGVFAVFGHTHAAPVLTTVDHLKVGGGKTANKADFKVVLGHSCPFVDKIRLSDTTDIVNHFDIPTLSALSVGTVFLYQRKMYSRFTSSSRSCKNCIVESGLGINCLHSLEQKFRILSKKFPRFFFYDFVNVFVKMFLDHDQCWAGPHAPQGICLGGGGGIRYEAITILE
jgi:hypothetical protein